MKLIDFSFAPKSKATEALDLAIEALQEPKSEQYKKGFEDAISKHDLWRIIEDNAYWVTYNETSKEKGMTITGINQALNECPPVEPERPKGEWIDRGDYAVCSRCAGTSWQQMNGVEHIPFKPKYCPECGADMRGDKE